MEDTTKFTYVPDKIQHIIRMFNTNINGTQPSIIALTGIRGIGRRLADAILKKANVTVTKRAGELNEEELSRIQEVITNPSNFDIPIWMFNRQRDFTDGSDNHLVANNLDACYRLFVERGKKMRHVRVTRLAMGLKVRGQRTKSNGRHGVTMGVSRKK